MHQKCTQITVSFCLFLLFIIIIIIIVIVFGPSRPKKSIPANLFPLTPYLKSHARNLGVILDSHLNLNKQISSVVKTSFYQLRIQTQVCSFIQ